MKQNNNYGFWLSYVDTMTGMAVLFLILFVAFLVRARKIDEKSETIISDWKQVLIELNAMNAAPIPDTLLGGIRITLADNILFNLNSAELSDTGIQKIKQISQLIANFLKKNPSYMKSLRIEIGGHTDKSGNDTINFPLSYNRSYSVSSVMKDVFKEENLDLNIIRNIGYGSKYPVPGTEKLIIAPINRRVTITLQLISTELLNLEQR